MKFFFVSTHKFGRYLSRQVIVFFLPFFSVLKTVSHVVFLGFYPVVTLWFSAECTVPCVHSSVLHYQLYLKVDFNK